jgi:hypothetical protein
VTFSIPIEFSLFKFIFKSRFLSDLPSPKLLLDTSIGSWVSKIDHLMSSLAAETIVDLDFKENFPDLSFLPSPTLESSGVQDLKKSSYFDDEYATKAGPSSAGLEEQGFFNDLPILEKGNELDSTPIPLTPFVLDESYIQRAEGGWAGWTCVAGSWLVCMSLPLDNC